MKRRPGREFQFAAADRAALDELRGALYRHHGQLVQSARREWEREHGPLSGPGELLQLLLGEPAFAWLRILSGLVAELDTLLDAPATDPAKAVVARIEGLFLEGSPEGDDFFAHHDAMVRDVPELVFSHVELRRAIFGAHDHDFAVTPIDASP